MTRQSNFIRPSDWSTTEYKEAFRLADLILQKPEEFSHSCEGKVLASLFFEPSTRTRLSFEAAFNRLGGRVIGFSDQGNTSTAKGESLADTLRIIEGYADLIVMRHFLEGAAFLGSQVLIRVPIINAGDGSHQHPTQTLTDLYTLHRYGKLNKKLTIGLCGDLKFGRTVHSLIEALELFGGCDYVCIAPEDLALPDYVKEKIQKGHVTYVEDLSQVMGDLDVLYMTRVQKERFVSEREYERLKDFYILDQEKMSLAKEDMIVMHPLPRVMEIEKSLDSDPRMVYFNQAHLGMYVRMALMMILLGVAND